MQDFKGRVAVITGAASGIGRAIASHCARQGMQLVLADIEEHALAETAQELQAEGATALAVPTDVSRFAEVEALAEQTYERFGAAHLG